MSTFARDRLAEVRACLQDGEWQRSGRELSLPWQNAWLSQREAKHDKFYCASSLLTESTPPSYTWHGFDSYTCPALLRAPLVNALDGLHGEHVALFVLGDSLGRQLEKALRVATAANPHLGSTIQFASWDANHARAKATLNFMPSTAEGAAALLDGIAWPASAGVRIVLANSGVHYNAHSLCSEVLLMAAYAAAAGEPPPPNDSFLRWVCQEGQSLLHANHTHPSASAIHQASGDASPHLRGLRTVGDLYEKARLAAQTDTIGEYARDVRALIAAARKWQQQGSAGHGGAGGHGSSSGNVDGGRSSRGHNGRPLHRFIWLETSPQHFAPPDWLGSSAHEERLAPPQTTEDPRAWGGADAAPGLTARERYAGRAKVAADKPCGDLAGSFWPSEPWLITAEARRICAQLVGANVGLAASDTTVANGTSRSGGSAALHGSGELHGEHSKRREHESLRAARSGGIGGGGVSMMGHGPRLGEPVSRAMADMLGRCQHSDWQNRVASPLMHQAGLPVVPLSPLRQRPELKLANAGPNAPRHGDCTHWCVASDATYFLAQATLSTVDAVLHERPPWRTMISAAASSEMRGAARPPSHERIPSGHGSEHNLDRLEGE